MKMIKRDTDYAIRALSCIVASKGEMVTVSGLATKLGMPGPYLRKILQRLSKEGLLRSIRGKGGGFVLAGNPGKITVFELMEIFQGDFQLSEHVFRGKVCPEIEVCQLKMKLNKLEKCLIKELKDISIKSIMVNRMNK
jgi:Rrf2 family transcriptional regulator, nitric oxide-sensitive transcriptional repressor